MTDTTIDVVAFGAPWGDVPGATAREFGGDESGPLCNDCPYDEVMRYFGNVWALVKDMEASRYQRIKTHYVSARVYGAPHVWQQGTVRIHPAPHPTSDLSKQMYESMHALVEQSATFQALDRKTAIMMTAQTQHAQWLIAKGFERVVEVGVLYTGVCHSHGQVFTQRNHIVFSSHTAAVVNDTAINGMGGIVTGTRSNIVIPPVFVSIRPDVREPSDTPYLYYNNVKSRRCGLEIAVAVLSKCRALPKGYCPSPLQDKWELAGEIDWPNCQLVITGLGMVDEMLDAMRARLSDDLAAAIHDQGVVTYEQAVDLARKALCTISPDCYHAPSAAHTACAIEAGCPVVAFGLGAHKEMHAEYPAGYYTAPMYTIDSFVETVAHAATQAVSDMHHRVQPPSVPDSFMRMDALDQLCEWFTHIKSNDAMGIPFELIRHFPSPPPTETVEASVQPTEPVEPTRTIEPDL